MPKSNQTSDSKSSNAISKTSKDDHRSPSSIKGNHAPANRNVKGQQQKGNPERGKTRSQHEDADNSNQASDESKE